jgi:hypothetical protein
MPATTSTQPLPESSLRLTASERAVFIGSATSTAKLVVAAVITLIGVGLTASNAAFLIVVVYGLLWANTSTVQIRIDDAGVLVRPRWIKWTVFRTPLSEIALARVARHQTAWQELEHPDERPRSKVIKVRIRPGPAIELVLHDEKSVSISLDQAEQAADVLNALIVRHRTAKDPTLTSQ